MQTSHVISDAVLSLVGFFVFFRYLLKLETTTTILWESFILSVATAAGLGALRFAGVDNVGEISIFFQKIAATVGAISIVIAAYSLVSGKSIGRGMMYGILILGFLLFATTEYFELTQIRDKIAMIGLPIVALIGIWAFTKGKTKVGFLLIGGVLFAALAVFSTKFIENASDSIDAYHYLLALSVLCFGMAASFQKKN